MRNNLNSHDSMLKINVTHKLGDNSSEAALRLKRWKARSWMRQNNVRDLGFTVPTPKITHS